MNENETPAATVTNWDAEMADRRMRVGRLHADGRAFMARMAAELEAVAGKDYPARVLEQAAAACASMGLALRQMKESGF